MCQSKTRLSHTRLKLSSFAMFRFVKQSLPQFRFLTISVCPPVPKYSVRKAWSNEENHILRNARASGMSWKDIAQSLPDRTSAACISRFARLAPLVSHDPNPIRDSSLAWTEDETRLLREKVTQYGFCWKFLADTYFPNRAPAQLFNHWTAVGNPCRKLGVWLPEEEERLLDATQNGNMSWQAVAQRVGTRNRTQCFFKHYNMTKSSQKGRFTDDESKAILDAFKRYPSDWKAIASEVKEVTGVERSPQQCREHYQRELDPRLMKGPWTAQEDKIIVDAYNHYGPKFSVISQLLPNYRGAVRVWRRVNTLKGHGVIKGRNSKDQL
ncbi:hypothetical protein BC936DRAFT_136617 [Jimgerdemannia flammicorona]|uniref:Homeodomain-like protein n=1 Tax=Jimgerdemannia flammicorona TaxID=994334 RepID=A0A433CZ58_9FUNG|nr:hypothetical protein BC936DRAFT_136617 [Jimgerdemannia flammicorona]